VLFGSLLINIVLKKKEFIATIHDSIVVKESWLDASEKIMRQCFLKKGINPQFSVNIFK